MSAARRVLAQFVRNDSLSHLPGGVIYAVNYHSVPQQELAGFVRHMRLVHDAGFECCGPANLRAVLRGEPEHRAKRLLVSFDDGCDDNLRAAEVLERMGWIGWFFVPAAAAAGKAEKLQQQFGSVRFMQATDMRELANRGHVLGAHGFDHVRLSDRIDDATRKREIVQSREVLEQSLGRSVPCFCWIGGETESYGVLAHRLIRTTYEMAFTTFAQPIAPGQNPHFLDRINLKTGYTDDDVRLAFSPWTRARHYLRKKAVMRRLIAGEA